MIWKMIGRWLLAAIALPLAAAGFRKLSRSMQARRGASRTTGVLDRSANVLTRFSGRQPVSARRGR